jgi:hypothetical protein
MVLDVAAAWLQHWPAARTQTEIAEMKVPSSRSGNEAQRWIESGAVRHVRPRSSPSTASSRSRVQAAFEYAIIANKSNPSWGGRHARR